MARFYTQAQVRDGLGRAVPGATVTVFLAGSTTWAAIYNASSGGVAIPGSAVTADATGYFGFWVDSDDYPSSQLFKIVASAPNYQYPIAGITWDNVLILPDSTVTPTVAAVTEGAAFPGSPAAYQQFVLNYGGRQKLYIYNTHSSEWVLIGDITG